MWGDGALAQLGERLNGIQEVSGSIPLGSTGKPERPMTSLIWTSVLITLSSVIVFLFMRAGKQQQSRYRKLRRRARNKAFYGWENVDEEGRLGEDGAEAGSLDEAVNGSGAVENRGNTEASNRDASD